MLQYSDSDFFEFQKYDLMKKIVLAIKCTNYKSTRNYLVRYHQHVLLQKDQNVSFVRINAIASVIRTLFPNFVSEKLQIKEKSFNQVYKKNFLF